MYGYANGDPINSSDPFGLSAASNDETSTASDTTSAGTSQSLNIASCAGAALTFSSLAVLDVLTVVSGVKVAAAGVSFAGRTLSAGLASSLSLSTANRYAAAAMGAGDALVNTAIPAAASGFVKDAPLTAAISGTEPGGTIGLSSFIPFSGTAGRVGRVASECATLSNKVPGFR